MYLIKNVIFNIFTINSYVNQGIEIKIHLSNMGNNFASNSMGQ